ARTCIPQLSRYRAHLARWRGHDAIPRLPRTYRGVFDARDLCSYLRHRARPSLLPRLTDVLVEERDRSFPGKLRCRRIVARRRVGVKTVLGCRVHNTLVTSVGCLERLLECRPVRVNAIIDFGRLD